MKITQKEAKSLYDKYMEDLIKNKEIIFKEELNKVYHKIKNEYKKGMCSYHINVDHNISYECKTFISKELEKDGYIISHHGYGSLTIDIYWAGSEYETKKFFIETRKEEEENKKADKKDDKKAVKSPWIKRFFKL